MSRCAPHASGSAACWLLCGHKLVLAVCLVMLLRLSFQQHVRLSSLQAVSATCAAPCKSNAPPHAAPAKLLSHQHDHSQQTVLHQVTVDTTVPVTGNQAPDHDGSKKTKSLAEDDIVTGMHCWHPTWHCWHPTMHGDPEGDKYAWSIPTYNSTTQSSACSSTTT